MPIEVRTPTDADWPAICQFDATVFSQSYANDDIEAMRQMHDMRRFRVVYDGSEIVGVAGSYAMEVTLPGGASVPMGGVTWVGTAATHRRQGVMTAMLDAIHADIDARGEPVASLYASQGGIYERFGYGHGTQIREISIDTHQARIRPEYRVPDGSVRFVNRDDDAGGLAEIWERYRRSRSGETGRTAADIDYSMRRSEAPAGGQTTRVYLRHPDGFASYRIEKPGNHRDHIVHLHELVAVTPEAHIALWQLLLSLDRVGVITGECVAIDDPLPYLLDDPRQVSTTTLSDGVWVNVRDVPMAFSARTYRTTDRLVVEADGRRWAIEGGPDGAECRSVRTKPDLITTRAGLSSLLYGGTAPSALVAGRRLTVRSAEVLERSDLFFPTNLAPHCQNRY